MKTNIQNHCLRKKIKLNWRVNYIQLECFTWLLYMYIEVNKINKVALNGTNSSKLNKRVGKG